MGEFLRDAAERIIVMKTVNEKVRAGVRVVINTTSTLNNN